MKNRKTFLATLGAGAIMALARRGDGHVDAVSSPSPPSAPAAPGRRPKKSRSAAVRRAKRPSAAALALAATYRRFDETLSEADVATIARGIDAANASAAGIDSKKKPLKNWNEPVSIFTVPA